MKKLLLYLIGFSFLTFMSCTTDDEVIPSGGEKAIDEIVKTLEDKEEISDFVEILKSTDLSNITDRTLTVFAVRNIVSASRGSSSVIDSVSIKRHIVKGSYAKSDFVDGKILESISGDKLYITKDGNEVYVNGVVIEGDAIPVGESYVYIISEVLGDINETEDSYTTTINVRELIWEQAYDEPLEGVHVSVSNAGNDSLGIWTEGEHLGDWVTDANGQIVVKHTSKDIVFYVYKDGYTDKYEKYIIKGVDENGRFIIEDTNGDGLINNNDKVFYPLPYHLGYDDGEMELSATAYMIDIDSEGVELPLPEASSVETRWREVISQYMMENVYLESRLTEGESSFDYKNDLIEASENYWETAYLTLDWGLSCVRSLEKAGGYSELANRIKVDMCLIKTQLYGYYNITVGYYDRVEMDKTIADINELVNNVDTDNERCALHLMLAKLYLIKKDYQESLANSEKVINYGIYSLGNNEKIWGGYYIWFPEETYVYPLSYGEILLMNSYANLKVARVDNGLHFYNMLRQYLNLPEVSSYNSGDIMNIGKTILPGTGQLYPYARITESSFAVDGFDASKNRLLPIPMFALSEYKNLIQNEGYF